MRKNTKIICLLLSLAMLLPCVLISVGAGKVVYDDIKTTDTEALRRQLEELEALRDSVAEKLRDAEKLQSDAAYRRELYLSMAAIYNDEIKNLDSISAALSEERARLEAERAEVQASRDETYERFCAVLRMTHEEGTASYVEILLGAESLGDLLARIERVGSMLRFNDKTLKKLEEENAALSEKVAQLEEKIASHAAAEAELAAKREELAAWTEENDAVLEAISDEIKSLVSDHEKYESEADILGEEFDAMIEAMIKAEQKRQDEIAAKLEQERLEKEEREKLEAEKKFQELLAEAASKQGFLWPLPHTFNEKWITSNYNDKRTITSLGYYNKVHYGTDIAAYSGTNIYASKDGKVLNAEYHSTRGYYVLIDHGNGVQTLYAHASKLEVKAGQTVKQGDVIAKVGSTGNSTGPHLHIEIRINGKTVDPMTLLIKP